MIMQILVTQEPMLPPDVEKHLFEGTKQYRVFFLQKKVDRGTSNYYYYKNSNGKLTNMYYEEFLNGRWVYRDEIPFDAFVKYAGKVVVNNEKILIET